MADTKSKKSAKKSGPSKAEFVRAQARTMPAKDVVAKAKAEGIALTDSYVYKLRSVKKGKAPAAAKAAKTPGKRRGRRPDAGSKTSFVLSLPFDLPAAAVVKKAEEKGIKISDKYVYTIRSSKRAKAARSSSGAAPTSSRAPRGRAAAATISSVARAVTTGVSQIGNIEQQFVRLAVALGTSRATDLLKRLDVKLSSLTL